MTIQSGDAADGLDWIARFKMFITGGATQKIFGELLIDGKTAQTDYAAGAKDLATAGGAIKLQIHNIDAGDTTTSEVLSIAYHQ